MDKLVKFLKNKPLPVKVVIIILVGIALYFSSGCGFHLDKLFIDNASSYVLPSY